MAFPLSATTNGFSLLRSDLNQTPCLSWGPISVRKAAAVYDSIHYPLGPRQVSCRSFVRHYTLHVEFLGGDYHIYAVPRSYPLGFHKFVSLLHVSSTTLSSAYAMMFYYVHNALDVLPYMPGRPTKYRLARFCDVTKFAGHTFDSMRVHCGNSMAKTVRKTVSRCALQPVKLLVERFALLEHIMSGAGYCSLTSHGACDHYCVGIDLASMIVDKLVVFGTARHDLYFTCTECSSSGCVRPIPLPLLHEHLYMHEFGARCILPLMPLRCFLRIGRYTIVVGSDRILVSDIKYDI